MEYLVKWKGYEEQTWVKQTILEEDCSMLLSHYKANFLDKRIFMNIEKSSYKVYMYNIDIPNARLKTSSIELYETTSVITYHNYTYERLHVDHEKKSHDLCTKI